MSSKPGLWKKQTVEEAADDLSQCDNQQQHRDSKEANGIAGVCDDCAPEKQESQRDHYSVVEAKKSVPVWRLFKYANLCDVVMIIMGTIMAVAAGLALPVHLILGGSVLNQFVYHDIVISNNLAVPMPSGETCETYRLRNNQTSQQSNAEYFCPINVSTSIVTVSVGNVNSVLRYFCEPDATLRTQIGFFSIIYVGLATGVLLSLFLATLLWNLSAYRQIRRMRKALYKSIVRQDIGWFDTIETGHLSTRLVEDVEKIRLGIGDKVAVFLQYLTTFIASFIIGFVVNWKLALVVSTALPVLLLLSVLLTKVIASFTEREQKLYARASGIAEEVLSAIRTVVAFGGEQKEINRFGEQLKNTRNESLKKNLLSNLIAGTLQLALFSTYPLSLWYGSVLILDCELSAGEVVIVFLSVINSSFALSNALPQLNAFATAIGSATAVFETIDRKPKIDWSSDSGEIPHHLNGDIEFKDVIFSYPAKPNNQILNGLNLTIKAGQTVALVGPSGCGKSTVLQLIQRFYTPLGGLLTVDGREISTYNLQWLRSQIGVVSQEPVLFNTSIAENIRYGHKDASMEDIVQAAKSSNAHHFISEMPNGYDTQVGQRGAQLSGGQKQRIAIARALVRNPKILILDEATSALDNQSEKTVQEALDKARQGRTTIVIAHRLSTIKNADIIIAISKGCVVESGSHDKLMNIKGLYHELVIAQQIEEEEEEILNQPLARFRAAVNKSIEQRQITLAKFRTAVKQSVAKSRKLESAHPSSTRHEVRRKSSLPQLPTRRRSSAFGVPLGFGAFSSQIEHDDLFEDLVEESHYEAKEDHSTQVDKGNHTLKHEVFKEVLMLIKPDWLFLLIGVVFSVLLGCLFPLMAVPFSEVLRLYGLNDPQAIRIGISHVSGGFLGLAVSAFLFFFITNFTLSMAGERLTKRLRFLSFKAMLRQDISWFDMQTNSTGALLTRLSSDTTAVKGATSVFLGTIFQGCCSLLTGVIIAFVTSWELALLMMIAFPVLTISNCIQIRILAKRARDNKKNTEEGGKTAVESIDNIRTVASLGLEPQFCDKYNSLLKGPLRSNIKSVAVQALMLGLGHSLLFYMYSAGLSLGAYLVTEERRSYDEVFRVLSAVYFTVSSISQVSSVAPDVSKAQASATRIIALLKQKPQINDSCHEGYKLDKVVGRIESKSVHFSYPSRPNVKILHCLDVSVKPGQTLALVGPSGCGKSTLVSLVERFYDPASGRVTLEGTDLKDLNLGWLREQIGFVPQEPVLFDGSIAENIRYGALHREVSDEEVIEAAKSANIHNFVESLPLGYATNVGSKGSQLSGGQKQRIAIARALIRNPKILLLDEATSALDTESEKVVQQALDKARQGRTSIVIAHRLSTIYNSDVIAVIHEGQVIEKGTHEYLMGLKEAYYHLNKAQLKVI